MNVTKAVSVLQEKYPGKKIILNTPDHTTEIICEIEPTALHPGRSTAIAVVDAIRPHYHNKLTEVYKIIKGKLTLYPPSQKTTGQFWPVDECAFLLLRRISTPPI